MNILAALNLPDTIAWDGGQVRLLDQRRLPGEVRYLNCRNSGQMEAAIKSLAVRGAPLIGIAGAFALALAAQAIHTRDVEVFRRRLTERAEHLLKTRPTAVNLAWACRRMLRLALREASVERLQELLKAESLNILREDQEQNQAIAEAGFALLNRDRCRVLTHCNAGHLATGGLGTALGPVYAAKLAGWPVRVIADETRPVLQGARLTAWELQRAGVPVTLAVDGAAGVLMQQGLVDCVIVGADRITAQGDVANKVGTFNLALQARRHQLPFYVAAPLSTIDLDADGPQAVPLEQRASREVTHLAGKRICPEGVEALNFAFDLTPPDLVSAIITEKGILRPPYRETLAAAKT